MASVTGKHRADPEITNIPKAASDAGSVDAILDERIGADEGGEVGDSGKDADDPSTSLKQRKHKKRKSTGGIVSEQEKTQAVSDMYEYKSNVFRMETEELLREVRLNYQKHMAPAEKVLHKLKSIIEDIPERLDISVGPSFKPVLIENQANHAIVDW